MSTSHDGSNEHEESFELIPWLVNGRLSQEQRHLLERHLGHCGECRREVAEQRRVRDAIRREESNVEHTPHASFQKLWSQIETSERDFPVPDGVDGDMDWTRRADSSREPLRSQRWMLAAAVVLAVGLGLVSAWSWRGPLRGNLPEYRTAAAPRSEPDRYGHIRAVFAPNVTVDELNRLVGESGLTIVGGPSESGVYTLAVQPARDWSVSAAVERLRDDPRVRFAEPVVAPAQVPP